jgi:hypothetical protein
MWHGDWDQDLASSTSLTYTGAIMKHLASACLSAFALLAYGMAIQPAAAAPFCLTSQVVPPQCIYFDASNCEREARRQNAVCSANPRELKLTTGIGQYCVVTTSQISTCTYADRQSCATDAARQQGTCVIAPTRAPMGLPDPYSAVNGQ